MRKIEYKIVPIEDINLHGVTEEEASATDLRIAKKTGSVLSGKVIKSVEVEGEEFAPTNRFWQSLYARFRINSSFFRFFNYDEVFKRISERSSNDLIRVCIERNKQGDRLLAATGLNKAVILYEDLQEILEAFHSEGGVKYADGIVTSTHSPRIGYNPFKIGDDKFCNKFMLHAPIDGYGRPNIYLSLLRLICSNGMVGWAQTFKTTLALGHGSDSVRTSLRRALDAFSNDEGYAVLRSRFELATRSWASLREQQDLYRLLLRLQNDVKLRTGGPEPGEYSGILSDIASAGGEGDAGGKGSAVARAFTRMTGDPYELYHTDPNVLSEKRLRTLPVGCKVYDLFNFATEVATHHVSESTGRSLQAWVGQMLSGEYDLEDSCDQFDDFKDRFLPKRDSDGIESTN
jgi:hypothetical protein